MPAGGETPGQPVDAQWGDLHHRIDRGRMDKGTEQRVEFVVMVQGAPGGARVEESGAVLRGSQQIPGPALSRRHLPRPRGDIGTEIGGKGRRRR